MRGFTWSVFYYSVDAMIFALALGFIFRLGQASLVYSERLDKSEHATMVAESYDQNDTVRDYVHDNIINVADANINDPTTEQWEHMYETGTYVSLGDMIYEVLHSENDDIDIYIAGKHVPHDVITSAMNGDMTEFTDNYLPYTENKLRRIYHYDTDGNIAEVLYSLTDITDDTYIANN